MRDRVVDGDVALTTVACVALELRGWARVEPDGFSLTRAGEVAFFRSVARDELAREFVKLEMESGRAGTAVVTMMTFAERDDDLARLDAAFGAGPLADEDRAALADRLAELEMVSGGARALLDGLAERLPEV